MGCRASVMAESFMMRCSPGLKDLHELRGITPMRARRSYRQLRSKLYRLSGHRSSVWYTRRRTIKTMRSQNADMQLALGNHIDLAVVGSWINAPKTCAADVGQARTDALLLLLRHKRQSTPDWYYAGSRAAAVFAARIAVDLGEATS